MLNDETNNSNGINTCDNDAYNCFSNNRTIYDRVDTDSYSTESKNVNDENVNDKNNIDININIYRYKFTEEFTEELFRFSKIHQYDHRKDFKEAWNIWTEENDDIVSVEIRRLTNAGYAGDILDKMFKSARYYFRKKSTEKKAPTARRIYVGVQKDLLDAMDDHIKYNINDKNYKPSEGFDKFCKDNVDLLKEEINMLCKNGFTDSFEIEKKFKKTYKNRYFLIISK